MTIRNGGLQSWAKAVVVEGGSFNAIRNVDALSSLSGASFTGGEGNLVRFSALSGAQFVFGLRVENSDAFIVADSSGRHWRIVGNGNRIVRNEVGDGGQFATCLYVFGSGNRVADNTIAGCENGGFYLSAGANNAIVGNEASGSQGTDEQEPDGFRLGAFTANTLFEGNYAHDNGDDGFDVQGTGTTLRNNRADDNGDFGIDAVAGVTDGGGNTASGNGNPLQCRNVFCQ